MIEFYLFLSRCCQFVCVSLNHNFESGNTVPQAQAPTQSQAKAKAKVQTQGGDGKLVLQPVSISPLPINNVNNNFYNYNVKVLNNNVDARNNNYSNSARALLDAKYMRQRRLVSLIKKQLNSTWE